MRTREEHLEFCKRRAREYLDRGKVADALASMCMDLRKHPETKGICEKLEPLAVMYAMQNDMLGAKSFIEGFR